MLLKQYREMQKMLKMFSSGKMKGVEAARDARRPDGSGRIVTSGGLPGRSV